jgi:hypothetical protein
MHRSGRNNPGRLRSSRDRQKNQELIVVFGRQGLFNLAGGPNGTAAAIRQRGIRYFCFG